MAASDSSVDLTGAVTELPGIGPERAALLARLGISRIGDLLFHRPRRYEDRRDTIKIVDLKKGETKTVEGTVVAAGLKRFAHGRKSVAEVVLDDGTARLHCRWWNLPYILRQFEVGQHWVAFGKVACEKPRSIDHPEIELVEDSEEFLHVHRIVPIYPLTEGIHQRWLRSLIWKGLDRFLTQPIPENATMDLAPLPNWRDAIRMLHFPASLAEAELARQRLAFEELFDLQSRLQQRRRRLVAKAQAARCRGNNDLIRPFLRRLGFELTSSQTKVLREIRKDLDSGAPMRRLLQGDVGSGKTVVAACAALMALESGWNVLIMAPTELLAEQHYQTFRSWLAELPVQLELRTGSVDLGNANPPQKGVSRLVIGTHALIQQDFTVERVGLVVIDEQHKFGVAQRESLLRKGFFPHLLVMTATPIPRTLGLTVYGDLDVSTIEHLPVGRQPVRTYLRPAAQWPKIAKFIRDKIGQGRQAFFVYPRIDSSAHEDIKGVAEERARLANEFPGFEIGMVHGRLPREDRERLMGRFRANQIQVLVATTVVEVGVDVPNATVMVIENAERFGLAQLHQLRGRIGRGTEESFCILMASKLTREARQRLTLLTQESDGFRIAEADLKLRGPGDFLGAEQSGIAPFRFADLIRDGPLIERARTLARSTTDIRR